MRKLKVLETGGACILTLANMMQSNSVLIFGATIFLLTLNILFSARIPVWLYVRSINQDFENFEDVPEIDTWDGITCLNRHVEFLEEEEEGKCFTLRDAIESLLLEFIGDRGQTSGEERTMEESEEADGLAEMGEIKLARIQGIEMELEIPFSWVVNNLKNPEFYLHISVLVKAPQR